MVSGRHSINDGERAWVKRGNRRWSMIMTELFSFYGWGLAALVGNPWSMTVANDHDWWLICIAIPRWYCTLIMCFSQQNNLTLCTSLHVRKYECTYIWMDELTDEWIGRGIEITPCPIYRTLTPLGHPTPRGQESPIINPNSPGGGGSFWPLPEYHSSH